MDSPSTSQVKDMPMGNAKALAVLAAVAVIAVLAYVGLGRLSPTASATIGEILAKNGFTEFKPPSEHALPGTLVVVKGGPTISLGVICRPQQALGISPADIPSSASVSTDLSAALDRSLSLDASLFERIKAGGRLSGIENIQIRLSNVRLLEVSDDDVLTGLPKRSQACRDALELRLASGGTVTMIKSALMADVTYVATASRDAGGEIAADVQSELAATLKSTVKGTDNGKVELTGQNLIWGIRDDEVLGRLGTTRPASTTESGARAVLPADAVVESLDLDTAASLLTRELRRMARGAGPSYPQPRGDG